MNQVQTTPAPPNSTKKTSSDVFFCAWNPVNAGGCSAIRVCERPARFMSFSIPNGIPRLQMQIFGIPKRLMEYQCTLKLLVLLNSRSEPPVVLHRYLGRSVPPKRPYHQQGQWHVSAWQLPNPRHEGRALEGKHSIPTHDLVSHRQ